MTDKEILLGLIDILKAERKEMRKLGYAHTIAYQNIPAEIKNLKDRIKNMGEQESC